MLLFPFMVFESQIREFGLTKEEREIYVRLLDEFENVAEYLKVRFGYTLRINLRFTKLQVPYVLYSGSLLGHLRHSGDVIPWDNDIDLAIDVEQTIKLIRHFSHDKQVEFSFFVDDFVIKTMFIF